MQQLQSNPTGGPVTESERAYVIESLQTTQVALHRAVDGLSVDQLTHKPGADAWSVAECVEHITLVEKGLFKALRAGLNEPADPNRRNAIRVSDIDVIKLVRSRSVPFPAPTPFVPTGRFATTAEALQVFDDLRSSVIELARTEPADLRTHYFEHVALGTLDAYQGLLTMAAHVERHRKQIEALTASPTFPQ